MTLFYIKNDECNTIEVGFLTESNSMKGISQPQQELLIQVNILPWVDHPSIPRYPAEEDLRGYFQQNRSVVHRESIIKRGFVSCIYSFPLESLSTSLGR